MMRRLRPVLLLALALTISADALRAQDGDTAPRPVAPIPSGQKEIRYTDESKIPPQLMAAIKAAGCRLDGWLPDVPVHVFQIGRSGRHHTIALAPCSRIVLLHKAFIFDRLMQAPRPMVFPAIDALGGIGTSFAPGYLTWDEKDQVLRAIRGTDLCPSPFLRYTYRFEPGEDRTTSWVLLKADIDPKGCDQQNRWELFWEAPTLADQQRPK